MKLWKGRFSKAATSSADEFNASIEFDHRLYKEDITGSIAHAKMLAKQGIIPQEDADLIVKTLKEILADIEAGKVEFTIESEDIHMNIESILTERIGDAGKKLHTARSRNDQIAVDIRLYLKKEIAETDHILGQLLDALAKLAKEHTDTVMPGYTHLQRAQPVTLAYHLLAYYQMFSRDRERFADCLKRVDRLPLGSGALAGTTYDTDRDFLAKELGFASVLPNGMDAVADRDFAIEFINCCAVTMMHLSRFCEELILWSSVEFSFVEIDDSFSTGSSIMPQKKNPDMAELIRGKSGRVYGDLMSLLTICKGLPLAYNKDLQEDKIPVFDAADTLKASLNIFREMILTMEVKKDNMESAAKYGYMNATELGVEQAHEGSQKSIEGYQESSKRLDKYKRCFDIIDLILNGTATAFHGVRTYQSCSSNIKSYLQLLNEYEEKILLKGKIWSSDTIIYTTSKQTIEDIKSSASSIYKSYIDLSAYLTGTAECKTESMMLCLQCINENMDAIDASVRNAYLTLWSYMTIRLGFWKKEIFRAKTIREMALEAYDTWKKSQYIAYNNLQNPSTEKHKALGGGGILGGRSREDI